MKTVKDKYVLVGADFAGFPLKEAVVADLKGRGWNVTDIGVKSANEDKPEMFHRIGLKVGAKITERGVMTSSAVILSNFIRFSMISPS